MPSDLLLLIDAWRAARRAAESPDYAAYREGYLRRAAAYRMVIRRRIQHYAR